MNTLSSALALVQVPAAGAAGAQTGSGSMLMTLGTFGLVFVIFYFLIIRPQNKKQKDAQKMIEAIKKGDKVITIGGVHATVYTVKDKTVILKVDDNVKMEFSKSAISSVVDAKAVDAKAADAKAIEDKSVGDAKPEAEKAVEDKK
jgi:preprotein translocase subunit YajC